MRRDQLEDLLRDSLRDRAQDVEATPALWQEVDRRRRARLRWRTWRVWSGALASAAAVLAAIVLAPLLLDAGEQQPEIAVDPPGAPAGQLLSGSAPAQLLPSHLVLARGEDLLLLDLRTGREHELPAPDGEVLDVAARPGTTPGEDLEVAYTATSARDGQRVGVISDDGGDVTVDEIPAGGPVDPTVVWDPDGEWIAWSWSDEASHVELSRIAGPVGDDPAGTPMHGDVPEHPREKRPLDGGMLLNDWFDEGLGGLHLAGTHVDGTYVQFGTDLSGEALRITESMPGPRGMEARSDASPTRAGSVGGYSVSDHGEGLQLRFTTPHDSWVLPLPDGLGDAPYVLDALLAAVTISDGEGAWLVTHDGEGGDAHVAELGDASAVSIVRGPDELEAEPEAEPRPEPEPEPDAPARG